MSEFFVHPSSCIDAGARIGSDTKIWHFSHIGNCVIGSHCTLGQNVYVANNVKIGNHVKIQNNVSVYEGVTLEDYVFCGPSMVFTNVRTPRSAFPRNTSDQFEKTLVRKGASIGANATIVCGITVGEWAMVGSGSVVTRDVQAHALMVGVPARQIGWVCRCGPTLDVDGGEATCPSCHRRYVLADGELTLTEDR